MQTRERVHRLVDELPEDELLAVEQLLAERRGKPGGFLGTFADAPEDDEPLTAEDIAAIDEAYADIAAGRTISHDELWRRLGHDAAR